MPVFVPVTLPVSLLRRSAGHLPSGKQALDCSDGNLKHPGNLPVIGIVVEMHRSCQLDLISSRKQSRFLPAIVFSADAVNDREKFVVGVKYGIPDNGGNRLIRFYLA